MPNDLFRTPEWRDWLWALAAEHQVPGAQIGLLELRGQGCANLRTIATGVTSLATGVGVDDNTLFQFGSITKIWTTTLVMLLVDAGRLTLDTRVIDVLPGFRLDQEHSDQILIRHLLTHTSGIDGDRDVDTGEGDDCLSLRVVSLADPVAVNTPLGWLSYSNAGFHLAGRIIEVLTGQSWDQAIEMNLVQPLEVVGATTDPRDTMRFRAAVGHVGGSHAGKPIVSPSRRHRQFDEGGANDPNMVTAGVFLEHFVQTSQPWAGLDVPTLNPGPALGDMTHGGIVGLRTTFELCEARSSNPPNACEPSLAARAGSGHRARGARRRAPFDRTWGEFGWRG